MRGRFPRAGLCLILLLGAFVSPATPQTTAQGSRGADPVPPVLRIPRVAHPPKLEDFLNGSAPDGLATVRGFRQRDPRDGEPVSEDTAAYLAYDDRNLYIVFVCKDDPAQVRARMAKRENAFADDLVGVLMDTFHDRRRAYYFLVNPLGIQADAIVTEGQGEDYSFDTLWHSEGRLTADGFIVWMAIPFKSLRFRGAEVQTWGIGFGRSIARKNESAWWPHVTRRVEGVVQQLATLDGLEKVSPGRNMQFVPYGLFAHSRFLDPPAAAFRTENDGRAGLDAKLVFHDAFTLDVALNPDFSQVESDEPQVTVNQRFEVFFPEKRPFFIENAGFFSTPINLFFSRRIADPQFGVRLTGKAGPWTLAGFVIDDRAPGKRPSTPPAFRGDRAGAGVVRVQREFAAQSSVGLFISSRDFAGTSNRLFALDTRLKLNRNWTLTGQLARSYSTQVGCTRCAGPAYSGEIRRDGLHFLYLGRYTDRSPDFRAQLGFIPRVDLRQTEQFVRYSWRPKQSRVLLFGPDVFTVVSWNRQGQVQDWFVDANFGADFRGPAGMGCRRVDAFELFQGFGFRKHYTDCGMNAAWLKWLEFNADYGWGSRVNYFPGSGFAAFLANANSASLGLTFRPTPRVRFDQTYLYTRLGTREGSTPAGTPVGIAIFNNHILRSKLNYQFSRELSLRAIVDYNSVLPNAQLVGLDRSKRLTSDVLLTYLVNPGTALYVGYTDLHENLDLTGTPPAVTRTTSPTRSTGRQFFVKLSYLFRF